MNLPLDPHQILSRDYCIQNEYAVLALDMGLGKSLVALAAWLKTGGNLLIICPSYLIPNWQEEIKKWFGDKKIVTAFKSGKDIYPILDSDIVVTSYGLAQKAEHLFSWADTVVLDEGHELKSMKAKRTEFIHKAVYENSIGRLQILTGTPIKNRVEEYYSLMALMNYSPKIKDSEFLRKYPDSVTFADHFSFRKEYTMEINNRYFKVIKWSGVRHVDELKKYLRGHYIRFSSDKILKLPPPRMKDILISEKMDRALWKAFDSYYEGGESNDAVTPTLKAEAALKKVPFTVRYVKGLFEEGVECLPVYTDHVQSCEALAAEFGVEPVTGKMPPSKRFKIVKDFQAGKTNIICATIKSLSTGIDLTRANNMVLNDIPWVPGDLQQVMFRILRRSQKRGCLFHRILGSPQDRKILEAIEEKNETIRQVV